VTLLFPPQQILCLVDLSPASGVVLSWARLFAAGFSARAEVLHVAEPPQFADPEGWGAEIELRKTELHGAVGTFAQASLGTKVPYHITIAEGHPVQVVLERLAKRLPDLIVMGSHGHDGMARVLLGSVAENAVRKTSCPMLVVKGAELPVGQARLKRVLCPVNLTEVERASAEVAATVASALGAELDVRHVVEDQDRPREAVAPQLRAWVPEGVRQCCKVSEAVVYGEPAEQIVEYVRANAVDLTVLGAAHRPFLEFTTLGRTTERVMRYSPSSVLLVPRRN